MNIALWFSSDGFPMITYIKNYKIMTENVFFKVPHPFLKKYWQDEKIYPELYINRRMSGAVSALSFRSESEPESITILRLLKTFQKNIGGLKLFGNTVIFSAFFTGIALPAGWISWSADITASRPSGLILSSAHSFRRRRIWIFWTSAWQNAKFDIHLIFK